jgi:hypothetical protein
MEKNDITADKGLGNNLLACCMPRASEIFQQGFLSELRDTIMNPRKKKKQSQWIRIKASGAGSIMELWMLEIIINVWHLPLPNPKT